MTFRHLIPAIALFLTLGALAGCGGPEEAQAETVDAPKPAIAFDGKVEPTYAGTWITDDKASTLVLTADGKADMTNVAKGRGVTKAKGEWKVSGSDLLFKVEGPESYVSRYAAELKGDHLRLKNKASKLDVEYKRSK